MIRSRVAVVRAHTQFSLELWVAAFRYYLKYHNRISSQPKVIGDNHERQNPLSTTLQTSTSLPLALGCDCNSVFAGVLVATALVMGPKSFVWVRKTYIVLTNIFAICVGFPGSGKSQAYQMTVQEPLQSLAFINHSCGWLTTRKGAFSGTYKTMAAQHY